MDIFFRFDVHMVGEGRGIPTEWEILSRAIARARLSYSTFALFSNPLPPPLPPHHSKM